MSVMPIQATAELRARRGEDVLVLQSLPMALFAGDAIERQSQRNHRQSVAMIAQRGGYSACEALAVLAGVSWVRVSKIDEELCHRILHTIYVAYKRGR
jgi:hypothetical protein